MEGRWGRVSRSGPEASGANAACAWLPGARMAVVASLAGASAGGAATVTVSEKDLHEDDLEDELSDEPPSPQLSERGKGSSPDRWTVQVTRQTRWQAD